MQKTRQGLAGAIEALVSRRRILDDELFEELEEILIRADVGVEVATEMVGRLRDEVKSRRITKPEQLRPALAQMVEQVLRFEGSRLAQAPAGPAVYLVVGVNGSGKTTSIGKLAYRLRREGKRVLLVAADTFRAAAVEQLEIWANRAGVELVKGEPGADPASVAFDGVQAGLARKADVVIIDTAGRLQSKANLMAELAKVHRVVEKALGRRPDEVLLVVDATTGQNGLSQARLFGEAVPVTGITLTKLDGTAKGGIVVAVGKQMGVPVKLVGVGEGLEDLREFDPGLFARALFT